jgi:tetratricopeptide (TPR) repeat protein
MVSIELHTPKAPFLLLLLYASVAPAAAPDLDRAVAIEQQILDRIASAQSSEGPHSEALVPLFSELGQLYRNLGREERAAAALEEARGVLRANRGLSSLDEAPLLEELIGIEEHLGYAEEAWQREHDLIALADAHPDDLRAADIYREIGDKRLYLLGRYLGGEFPPQLALGCYYHGGPNDLAPIERNCTAGSRSVLITALIVDAWRYYRSAIKALSDNKLYSSTDLHELEMRIVRSAYALGAYSVGRRSLERLLSYDVANDKPSLTRLDSLIEIADWDVAMGRWSAALDTYERVLAQLRREGVEQKSIDALFAPDVPTIVPTFLPNPLMSRRAAQTTGHIDVTFEVTKFGYARRVRVLDSSTDVPRDARKKLLQEIYRGNFRPRVIDGHFADAAPVVLRYYVASEPQ